MTESELVRHIVEEVLRLLKPATCQPAGDAGKIKVLVIITGGIIGAKTALRQLILLKERLGDALSYTVLFSRAAARIHPWEEWGYKMGALEVLVEGKNVEGRAAEALKKCSLVAVPVLTRATAARIALQLLDSAAAEAVTDALMRGIPVIAARDAADSMSPGYIQLGMSRGSPALSRALSANLEQIATYGVALVPVDEFGNALEQAFMELRDRGVSSRRSLSITQMPEDGRRIIITSADLRILPGSDGVLKVPRGAMITPLGWDVIRDAGWKVEEV